MAKNTYIPIEAEAHTPPYKIHKYFARRPHNVFNQIINNFTEKGDILLDPFCGGGVSIYEGLSLNRKVIGCDLNPLSTFIVRNMVKKNDLTPFFKAVNEVKEYVSYLQADYSYFLYEGKKYTIDWSEMALSVRCPSCGRPTPLSNDLKVKVGKYHCSNQFCENHNNNTFETKNCERAPAQYVYHIHALGKKLIAKEPDETDEKIYNEHIRFLKKQLIQNDITIPQDRIPMDWDRQFEDGLLKKGIIYFQDLFTKRNLYLLLLIKKKIDSFRGKIDEDNYELLRIVFSNTLKDTNIMSFTNSGWQSGRPTTWSKHAYWIPNQFCEVSILPSFEKAIERVVAAIQFNQKKNYSLHKAKSFDDMLHDGNMLLINNSVAHTDIPSNSIDAIITDPPYGSNVQYLELSHFWFPWNKDLYNGYPDFSEEAISNRKKGFKGAKSQYDYERNLFTVFEKTYDVLKPNKYMVLTFNNKDMSAWLALLFSIFKSGFTFDNIYFQDGVKNYKQTAHTKAEGSPFGDFIYVFKKGESNNSHSFSTEESFISTIDSIFEKYLEKSTKDRNLTILDLFKNAIPYIEGFAKTYLQSHKEHSLYTHFNKKYLETLFNININEE